MTSLRRRALLKVAGTVCGAALGAGWKRSFAADPSAATVLPIDWTAGTKLVLLGTMAGPVLDPARAMSSQIVFVNGRGHLVDCGLGALMRMTEMGIRLPQVQNVYLTHHHSDHTADYPALVNMAWIIGIKGQMEMYGPPPLRKMHEAALAVFEEDVSIRVRATGREPIAKSFAVHEITEPGLVFEDEHVKVTAARAVHPPFEVALAYRFDTSSRSIVISGDTSYSEHIVTLAKDADVLVHEAMFIPGIDAMLAKRPYVPPSLRSFLLQGHTSVEDAGRVAAAANVKTLVLSHLLPGDEPIPDDVWIEQAARHFAGHIVVGKDRTIL